MKAAGIIWKNEQIIFVKKNLKINIKKKKKNCKVRNHSHYTWEYRGTALDICNLKYIVSKKFPHFLITELIMIIILSKWNVRIEMKYNGMKCKYCDCFLECTNFKDDLIEYKCLNCNKIYWGKFDEKLEDSFFNTYKFSIFDNKKFIAFLWKGVYPCKYVDDWEKFNETTLPEKEDFYSPLNIKILLMQIMCTQKKILK